MFQTHNLGSYINYIYKEIMIYKRKIIQKYAVKN